MKSSSYGKGVGLVLAAALFFMLTVTAGRLDAQVAPWGQFCGPNGSGVDSSTGYAVHIGEEIYATPALSGGRLYVP